MYSRGRNGRKRITVFNNFHFTLVNRYGAQNNFWGAIQKQNYGRKRRYACLTIDKKMLVPKKVYCKIQVSISAIIYSYIPVCLSLFFKNLSSFSQKREGRENFLSDGYIPIIQWSFWSFFFDDMFRFQNTYTPQYICATRLRENDTWFLEKIMRN